MRKTYQGTASESKQKFAVAGNRQLAVSLPLPLVEVWKELQPEVEHLTGMAGLKIIRAVIEDEVQRMGLEAAARSFCGELSAHNRAEVDFRAEDIPKNLSRDVSLCLFRVLQEALQNAAKHSGVKHFEAALCKELDEIHLSVRDRGIGFDIEDAVASRGIGLTSMRERLKLVDGELAIVSRRGFGTSIQARVPIVPKIGAVHA